MNHLLALDLGTVFGYAFGLLGDAAPFRSGTADCSKVELGEAFFAWATWLAQWDGWGVTVAYEKIAFNSGLLAARKYGGFEAILLMQARKFRWAVVEVQPKEAKRALTGRPLADKRMMAEAAARLLPERKIQNHDEADAIGVWLAAKRRLTG